MERGVDFARYRTYNWGPADALPTGDPRLDGNPFFKDYLQGAVERHLAMRGLQLVAADAPADLLIHYHASVTQRIRIDESTFSSTNQTVSEYEEGTIVLDIMDARTNKIIWRGWAQENLEAFVEDQERMRRHIDEAVARMMKAFPKAATVG
jgi:hypothetical protein